MSPEKILPELHFDETVCRHLESAARREWLETNGLGGCASSTVACMNTRRYHGLLVAALRPPVARTVLLSSVNETLEVDGATYEFGTNCFPGAIHPKGYQLLKEFHLDPFPRWVYEAGGVRVEKRLFMVHGHNAVALTYEATRPGGEPLAAKTAAGTRLFVRPFLTVRDHHSLTKANEFVQTEPQVDENLLMFQLYEGAPRLLFNHNGWKFEPGPMWYYNFDYMVERERGLDCLEDLFTPGRMVFPFRNGRACLLVTAEQLARNVAAIRHSAALPDVVDMLRDKELRRRRALLKGFEKAEESTRRLVLSADSFIARRGEKSYTVLAGWPWFTDWGRDTMITLPGLTIATRRFDIAREILATFASHVHRGLIPNVFPDAGGEPAYNTADATLWFFIAAAQYLEATGDDSFLANTLWSVFEEIVHYHRRGTLFDIHADADGLLSAGNEKTQLTWMDAKVGDFVVTPRHGKAVELNALWYNALRYMEKFAQRVHADPAPYAAMAEAAMRGFNNTFWNASAGCLYDVVRGERKDSSIRPNQIFAISLPHSLLSAERAASVLDVVQRKLLTPFGLRTLASDDPAYRGRCVGGVMERDTAYHQGTVWPWLMGPYLSAFLRVKGRDENIRAAARNSLHALLEHLSDYGLNSISEIFDGDPPHTPRGCFAQAWSVSETLRIIVELWQK